MVSAHAVIVHNMFVMKWYEIKSSVEATIYSPEFLVPYMATCTAVLVFLFIFLLFQYIEERLSIPTIEVRANSPVYMERGDVTSFVDD